MVAARDVGGGSSGGLQRRARFTQQPFAIGREPLGAFPRRIRDVAGHPKEYAAFRDDDHGVQCDAPQAATVGKHTRGKSRS
ncbi:MAG: hypothetical protein LC659_06715, partial [Myxococcales bacterium]|nr:hypothetical protein [Myxococcales bacterium]